MGFGGGIRLAIESAAAGMPSRLGFLGGLLASGGAKGWGKGFEGAIESALSRP